MRSHRVLVFALAALLTAGLATADFKISKQHHQDGFSMMGQTHPPTDEVQVTWIGDQKMRMDQGKTSSIVDLEAKTITVIDHEKKTFTVVQLPVDLEKLLPPGMGEQMLQMMKFDVTVTPTDETKKVGEWNAKRYDMTLTSAMMSMEMVLWASTETPIDYDRYRDLYSAVTSLQPGMDAMMDEMKKVDGYVVSQEGKMSMKFMGETTVGTSDEVLSIEELDPPAGIYVPPGDYAEEEFDYMKMMQNQ